MGSTGTSFLHFFARQHQEAPIAKMWTFLFGTVLAVFILSGCMISVNSQQECNLENIRLVSGSSPLEGNVEICFGLEWGAICADSWDKMDATVVCRELGFSTTDSRNYSGQQVSEMTYLDKVSCKGTEQRLSDCPSNMIPDCNTSQAAAVQCLPNSPRSVITKVSDTSVLITWQAPGVTLPDHYNITLAYKQNSHSSNLTFSTVIQVLGTETRLEYDRLFPQQEYSYCVFAVYGPETKPFCHIFQTEPLSSDITFVVMVTMGGVIALLVFLLVCTGTGLAYPRCIRPRMKDKKCLSRISRFLDNRIYLITTTKPSKKMAPTAADNAEKKEGDDSYEAVDYPPPRPVKYANIMHAVVTHH